MISIVIPNLVSLTILKTHFSQYFNFFSKYDIEDIIFVGPEDDCFFYVQRHFPGIRVCVDDADSHFHLLREGARVAHYDLIFCLHPMVQLTAFELDFISLFGNNDRLGFVSLAVDEICDDGTLISFQNQEKVFHKGLFTFSKSVCFDLEKTAFSNLSSCVIRKDLLLELYCSFHFDYFISYFISHLIFLKKFSGIISFDVRGEIVLDDTSTQYDFVLKKQLLREKYLFFWLTNGSAFYFISHLFFLILYLFFFKPFHFRAILFAFYDLFFVWKNHFSLKKFIRS